MKIKLKGGPCDGQTVTHSRQIPPGIDFIQPVFGKGNFIYKILEDFEDGCQIGIFKRREIHWCENHPRREAVDLIEIKPGTLKYLCRSCRNNWSKKLFK